jgi:sugar/nucleoside kinase (ribokinase family)
MEQVAARPGSAVFVGAAAQDVIALLPRFPLPDERVLAEDIMTAGGGPAATAAVAFVRLGGQAYFVGTVGDDAAGDAILDDLRNEGVDVSGAVRVPKEPSMRCVILVDRGCATRTICALPGPVLQIPEGSVAAEMIRSAKWVHVDHFGWRPVHEFLGSKGGTEPRISVDLGIPVAGFSVQGIDIFAPAHVQLVALYGQKPVPELLQAAVKRGAKCAVGTAGSAGSWAMTADGASCHVPAYRGEIISTLGAGDVFHGALLAAITRGRPLAECLAYANITAALSCRGLDGRSAIPHHAEVQAALPILLSEQEISR